MSAHDGQPRKRGGRVADKTTPGQGTALARNLPLTHSVLGKAIDNATLDWLQCIGRFIEGPGDEGVTVMADASRPTSL